jgi:hypothetical protein
MPMGAATLTVDQDARLGCRFFFVPIPPPRPVDLLPIIADRNPCENPAATRADKR